MTWPARRLVFKGHATLGDLATMTLDECETHNRFLDAWEEAEYIRDKKR